MAGAREGLLARPSGPGRGVADRLAARAAAPLAGGRAAAGTWPGCRAVFDRGAAAATPRAPCVRSRRGCGSAGTSAVLGGHEAGAPPARAVRDDEPAAP